ncbi:MAG: phosphoribosylglycinamide formyltransferase [Pseudomonadota bacterium]|nr:phosphoribosylglycinamide formyltransferase [Pseudomonadota bacterium]
MADKVRVGVLISGRGSNMRALEEWNRRGTRHYEIGLVAANDPDARGLMAAKIFGLPTWAKSHKGIERAAFDRLLSDALKAQRIEVVALAGYMRLLSPLFIAEWEGRILNVHPSLLPAHKGLDTHRRALEAGDGFAGCSVHLVTDALDDGPVLAQAKVRIREDDSAKTIAARVLKEEHRLYPEALDNFCRTLQDGDQPTISSAPKK